MDDCWLQEMEEASKRGEDLAPYPARMERCRWDHDVTDCEVCRGNGILPARVRIQALQRGHPLVGWEAVDAIAFRVFRHTRSFDQIFRLHQDTLDMACI